MNTTERYAALVRALRSGNQFPGGAIRRILTETGRTSDQLLADAFGNGDQVMSGDPCPDCAGLLTVIDSRVVDGNLRVRKIGCRKCGHRSDGQIFTTG